MNRLQILYTPCALLTRCSGHTTSQAKKNKTNRTKKSSTHIICWMPMSHKEQLSKGHRRCRSERRKGSQPRNQTPDSQKGVACFSTFKQVFRFFFLCSSPAERLWNPEGSKTSEHSNKNTMGSQKQCCRSVVFLPGPLESIGAQPSATNKTLLDARNEQQKRARDQ